MSLGQATTHALEHEYRFIDSLRQWSRAGVKLGVAACLKAYLKAIDKRVLGLNGRDLLADHERRAMRMRAQTMLDSL
jgi:hypothetical protein